MTPNKGSGPPTLVPVYISEVNGATDVKSSYEEELRPLAEIFPYDVAGDSTPTQIFPNFWNCPKRVELGNSYSGCMLI